MLRVEADGDLVGLVGQGKVAYANAYVTYVVPDLGLSYVICERKGSFEATQSHVVLTSIEAA